MVEKSRRDRIALAYSRLISGQAKTRACIAFVHKRSERKTLSHFLDNATEKQVAHLEGLLDV